MKCFRAAFIATAALIVFGSLLLPAAAEEDRKFGLDAFDSAYRDTMKGKAVFSSAPDYPGIPSNGPPLVTEPCGPQLAAAPMVIGSEDSFAKMGGLIKGAGMGLFGKMLSQASGGVVSTGGGKSDKPDMYKDPIAKKYKTKLKKHRQSGATLRMGAVLGRDEIHISTRLDKAKNKGTVHNIYLERVDCRRIYPYDEWLYEIWGKWSLSVSWSKTTSTTSNGKRTESTESGGFSAQGESLADLVAATMPMAEELKNVAPEHQEEISNYQSTLRKEMESPTWKRLGFGAPTSGARAMGARFRLSQADIEALLAGEMIAVLHITGQKGKFFQTAGIPLAMRPSKDAYFTFENIEIKKF